jgi:hypothetical protein
VNKRNVIDFQAARRRHLRLPIPDADSLEILALLLSGCPACDAEKIQSFADHCRVDVRDIVRAFYRRGTFSAFSEYEN